MKLKTCPECNGEGACDYTVRGGDWPWRRLTCEECFGHGTIEDKEDEDETKQENQAA